MSGKYRSSEEVRVRRLFQVKMTFLPHSVVQPDSTEHPSRRKGRPEADIGPTWFFCPVVKPLELHCKSTRAGSNLTQGEKS